MTLGPRRIAALFAALFAVAGCASAEFPTKTSADPVLVSPAIHDDTLVTSDGIRLPLRSWLPTEGPPIAVLVALHGFNDYSRFFEEPGRWLAARGIASYAYDQRGFGDAPGRGLWPGTTALVSDLCAAVTDVRKRHPGVPVYIFGESMGGAVVMATVAGRHPPEVAGAILAAPAVWGRDTMPWYQTVALWTAVRTFPSSRLTGAGLGIMPSDNIEMLRALGRDPLVIKSTRIDAVWGLVNLMDEAAVSARTIETPLLVLYGRHDELIPENAMDEMLERLPADARDRQRLVLYPEGWHMLVRDRQAEVVWRDIAAWITDRARPLPSGAEASRGALASAVPTGPPLTGAAY